MSTIVFTADTIKRFAANSRRVSEYRASIQNLTGETITITVTNQNIQSANPVFNNPAAGVLIIINGAIGLIDDAYDGWLISASSFQIQL